MSAEAKSEQVSAGALGDGEEPLAHESSVPPLVRRQVLHHKFAGKGDEEIAKLLEVTVADIHEVCAPYNATNETVGSVKGKGWSLAGFSGEGKVRWPSAEAISSSDWSNEDFIITRTATQLAAAIRGREVTSEAVTAAFLNRIAEVNPVINAVVEVNPRALEDAKAKDEQLASADVSTLPPLFGVPMTFKERFSIKGFKQTLASWVFADLVMDEDAPVVARLKAAGVVILGTTNEPEMGLAYETMNRVYGRTCNPHALDRVTGGSTGGEAAIIAAYGSPCGLGSDMGGSIRVPAAFCGIYGLKPTNGQVPLTNPGPLPIIAAGLSNRLRVWGPMARCAEDLEVMLHIVSGRDGEDPLCRARPYAHKACDVDMKSLTIGVVHNDGCSLPHQVVREVMTAAQRRLEGLQESVGITVKQITLPPLTRTNEMFLRLARRRSHEGGLGKLLPPLLRSELASNLLNNNKPSDGIRTAAGYEKLILDFDVLMSDLMKAFKAEGVDVVVMPAATTPAVKHFTTVMGAPRWNYTAAFNITGFPAAAIPFTPEREDEVPSLAASEYAQLPLSVQLVALPDNEDRILAVAKILSGR